MMGVSIHVKAVHTSQPSAFCRQDQDTLRGLISEFPSASYCLHPFFKLQGIQEQVNLSWLKVNSGRDSHGLLILA